MTTKQDCTDILKNIWTKKGVSRAVFCTPILIIFMTIAIIVMGLNNVMERINHKIMEWIES